MTPRNTPPPERYGIAAGGNWIIDHVKQIECLPERGMLAGILDESFSTGGAAANVLIDLARLQTGLPLSGYGVVGADSKGQDIRAACKRHGIDASGILSMPGHPTSYTDVISERQGGARTFFHQRGANSLFEPQHVPVENLGCRIFHLGYLLLLDAMDAPHPVYKTQAAALLDSLRQRGIRTSIDVVSEDSDRFARIVPPALPYVDYLIINEIEAGRITGRALRKTDHKLDAEVCRQALNQLAEMGAMELTVVHMAEGAIYRLRDGEIGAAGAVDVPPDYIRGTVGAGDAFCAGALYGLHEQWPMDRVLGLANAVAAASLSHPAASDGVLPLEQTLAVTASYPPMQPPI